MNSLIERYSAYILQWAQTPSLSFIICNCFNLIAEKIQVRFLMAQTQGNISLK